MDQRKLKETKAIDRVELNEDGEYDTDPGHPPTIELSKRDAKHFYHGIRATTWYVELPDGSTGALKIAPSEWHRTPFSRLRSEWDHFKRALDQWIFEKSEAVAGWLSNKIDGGAQE